MKVWINGCFDILHFGHFNLINFATSLGEHLTIGIDSDKRVNIAKGTDRPYHSVEQRKYNLLSIKGVSNVVTFNTDTELIDEVKKYAPDIFVIGSDYKNKTILGSEYAKKIVYFNRIEGLSTSNILKYEYNGYR